MPSVGNYRYVRLSHLGNIVLRIKSTTIYFGLLASTLVLGIDEQNTHVSCILWQTLMIYANLVQLNCSRAYRKRHTVKPVFRGHPREGQKLAA